MSEDPFLSDEEEVYMNVRSAEEEPVDISSLRLDLQRFQEVSLIRICDHVGRRCAGGVKEQR